MRTFHVLGASFVAAILGFVQNSDAELILAEPLEQTRWVRAEGRLFDEHETAFEEAVDFGPFQETSDITIVLEDEFARNEVHAQASQASELNISMERVLVEYHSSMGVGMLLAAPAEEDADGRAESFIEFVFRLHIPHFYSMPPGVEVVPGGPRDADVLEARLFREGGEAIVDGFGNIDFEGSGGLLPAGLYTLRHHGALDRSIPTPGDTGELAFQLELVPIPLPAAVWTGLMTLAGLGMVSRLRRVEGAWRRGR